MQTTKEQLRILLTKHSVVLYAVAKSGSEYYTYSNLCFRISDHFSRRSPALQFIFRDLELCFINEDDKWEYGLTLERAEALIASVKWQNAERKNQLLKNKELMLKAIKEDNIKEACSIYENTYFQDDLFSPEALKEFKSGEIVGALNERARSFGNPFIPLSWYESRLWANFPYDFKELKAVFIDCFSKFGFGGAEWLYNRGMNFNKCVDGEDKKKLEAFFKRGEFLFLCN